jgi:lipopolysaccharide/colanic/teichoic acid biosynthesis glycosyltransferase
MMGYLSDPAAMNIQHQMSIWHDAAAFHAQPVSQKRRRRWPGAAKYIWFGIFATVVSIINPMLLALAGVGMSPQAMEVVFNGALASLLAIIAGFLVTRRLLSVPLLQSYGYVALTFVSSFALVAIGLKILRIDFSSPQFFLAMALITGLSELFFYANRQWVPMKIAVVPGATPLVQLPELLLDSVEFTMLSSVPTIDFGYSGVIADLTLDLDPKWERFLALAALRGIPVYHVKQFNESMSGRVVLDHLRENTLGAVVPSLIYPQFKRAIDFWAALFCLPVVATILGVCAILIKLDTPGPIFYCQRRAGFGGRPFTIFKLRTMTQNHRGGDYTLEGDKRITRVGRFLRRYRLDELPQIINILRGDMSWIGPRPEAISLAEWYECEVPFYIYRHIVRPGMSGWAQVHHGNVAAVDAARLKLEYDFYYIKHFSFWLDAVIVLKTVRAIVTGFGSR